MIGPPRPSLPNWAPGLLMTSTDSRSAAGSALIAAARLSPCIMAEGLPSI